MLHLDVLRAAGWSVAVHNDYRLSGGTHTFWLMTHPCGRWIKGEGKTDEQALAICLKQSADIVIVDELAEYERKAASDLHRDTILKEAVEALNVFTGHDSHVRLKSRYGDRWWEPVQEIRGKLETLIGGGAHG